MLQTHPGAQAVKPSPRLRCSRDHDEKNRRDLAAEPIPRPDPSTECVSSSRCHRRRNALCSRVAETVFKGRPRLGASSEWRVANRGNSEAPFAIRPSLFASLPPGGARRDRTDDLMLAKHALSQLSYGPSWVDANGAWRMANRAKQRFHSPFATRYSPASIWWAWEDLNLRPHAYQARALTN